MPKSTNHKDYSAVEEMLQESLNTRLSIRIHPNNTPSQLSIRNTTGATETTAPTTERGITGKQNTKITYNYLSRNVGTSDEVHQSEFLRHAAGLWPHISLP